MRAVVQRCNGASVSVDGHEVGAFQGPGLLALVGVARGDDQDQAERLANKLWRLRLFSPDQLGEHLELPATAKGDLSAADLSLPILVISQFTLYGRTNKGRRPTWEDAAPSIEAEPLIDHLIVKLQELGADVSTGVFGADMEVASKNDGPMTLIVDA